MPRFIAAIDQGTTSSRCLLFDAAGLPVASAQKEHRQVYPQPGWVEHDPAEIWRNTQEVVVSAIERVGAKPGDIAGVGITNQRETIVAWDRETGQPLHNAIVWQDTRTKDLCDELGRDGGQDRFRDLVGLPLATYFSGPKIRWLLENVPNVKQAASSGRLALGTIDSWLVWNLTNGVHITDVTNASRTMLMDLRTLQWDAEMLKVMRVPREALPTIVASVERNPLGITRKDGPFKDAIPIGGILGDQHAALVGQTCFSPGESKNTYGTGCFMLLNTGTKLVPSKSGLLTTVAYQVKGEAPVYALEGSIAVAGSLVQWLRDNLGLIEQSPDVELLAQTVTDNGGIYFVPAFSGLFAPYWRSDARGVIAGLTAYASKGHLARAVLEAVAYQTRDVLDAMQRDSGVQLKSLRVDGGMAVNDLLMQFQADMLGVPVIRPTITETTVLGAAYAAGLSVGFWTGVDQLCHQWQAAKTWTPQMPPAERERLLAQWRKAVERSLNWVQ
jgi:glycerol kinase